MANPYLVDEPVSTYYEVVGLLSAHSDTQLKEMQRDWGERLNSMFYRARMVLEFTFMMTPLGDRGSALPAWKAQCFLKFSVCEKKKSSSPSERIELKEYLERSADVFISTFGDAIFFKKLTSQDHHIATIATLHAAFMHGQSSNVGHLQGKFSDLFDFRELYRSLRLNFPLSLTMTVTFDHAGALKQLKKQMLIEKMKALFCLQKPAKSSREALLFDDAIQGQALANVNLNWNVLSANNKYSLDQVMHESGWDNLRSNQSNGVVCGLSEIMAFLPLTHPGSTHNSSGFKLMTSDSIAYKFRPNGIGRNVSHALILGKNSLTVKVFEDAINKAASEEQQKDFSSFTVQTDRSPVSDYSQRIIILSLDCDVRFNIFDFLYDEFNEAGLTGLVFSQAIFDGVENINNAHIALADELISIVQRRFDLSGSPKSYIPGIDRKTDEAIKIHNIHATSWLHIANELKKLGLMSEYISAMRNASPVFEDVYDTLQMSISYRNKLSKIPVKLSNDSTSDMLSFFDSKIIELMNNCPFLLGKTNIDVELPRFTTIVIDTKLASERITSLMYSIVIAFCEYQLAFLNGKIKRLNLKDWGSLRHSKYAENHIVYAFRTLRRYAVSLSFFIDKLDDAPKDIVQNAPTILVLDPPTWRGDEFGRTDITRWFQELMDSTHNHHQGGFEFLLFKNNERGGFVSQRLRLI